MCIRDRWKSGIVSGLGAALADTLYGAAAGFSISLVIQFVVREEFWIRLIGGILLMGIGAAYYCKAPVSLEGGKDGSANSDLVSALLLTVTCLLYTSRTFSAGCTSAPRRPRKFSPCSLRESALAVSNG